MAGIRRSRCIAVLAPLIAIACGPSGNTVVERACRADGDGSSPVCSCVQDVADRTLSDSDQQRAAGFFAEPQTAQDVRMSQDPADDAFWDRYRRFTDSAERICG